MTDCGEIAKFYRSNLMYTPLTPEEKFQIIQSHRDYICHRIRSAAEFKKGDVLMAGSWHDKNDRWLVKVRRAYTKTLTTECGLRFNYSWNALEHHDEENDRRIYLFGVNSTFNWLHPLLPLDEALDYIRNLTGYQKFQYSTSHYNWLISCFRGQHCVESAAAQFSVRKYPESDLSPKELARINEYNAKELPMFKVIKFEDVKAAKQSLVNI